MTQLTKDDVAHIAKLCRLNVSDAEMEKYCKELTQILSFVSKLSEVDTKGVQPTAQVTGLFNGFRSDTILDNGIDPDDLLACSGLPIVDHQIQTPSAHG